MTEHARTIHPT
jgi:hypothetical protein